MTAIDWTPEAVEARLDEAADVMRRLPPVRVQGYFSTWPTVLAEFSDLVGQEPKPLRRSPPAPDAISRMDETLTWLRWLEPDDAKLVWMRAERKPWKAVCWRFGLARSTANRRYAYALNLIAWRLRKRPVPKTWSKAFLIRRMDFLSSEF